MHQWLRTMLLLPLTLASGCATHALWTESKLDNWNEPAPQSNLRLFAADPPQDVLVLYEEYSDRCESIRTRAYLLNENQKRLAQNRAPLFVGTNQTNGLPAVPVFHLPTSLATNQQHGLFAIAATNNQSFTLYCGDRNLGSHDLPVYNDGTGKYKRVALTPLAVTADLTVVGGVAGVWCWACLAGASDPFWIP